MQDWIALLLLFFGGKKDDQAERPRRELPLEVTPPASEASPPSTPAPRPPDAPGPVDVTPDAQSLSYQARWEGLMRRARAGEPWRGILEATAPPQFSDPRWAAAIARLVGMESGGQVTARSPLGEIGLLQIRRQFAVGPGKLTAAEFDSYGRTSTPRSEIARISWKIVRHLDGRTPEAWIGNVEQRIWRVGMRHGLPALLDDLVTKAFIVPDDPRGSPPGAILDHAKDEYEPSPLVARFALPRRAAGSLDAADLLLQQRVGWRVLVRFVTRADVITNWRRDWP